MSVILFGFIFNPFMTLFSLDTKYIHISPSFLSFTVLGFVPLNHQSYLPMTPPLHFVRCLVFDVWCLVSIGNEMCWRNFLDITEKRPIQTHYITFPQFMSVYVLYYQYMYVSVRYFSVLCVFFFLILHVSVHFCLFLSVSVCFCPFGEFYWIRP